MVNSARMKFPRRNAEVTWKEEAAVASDPAIAETQPDLISSTDFPNQVGTHTKADGSHRQWGPWLQDGLRLVDFVLMFEDSVSSCEEARRRRQFFEENLQNVGLELEMDSHERVDPQSGMAIMSVFVKVHAPWPVLCRHAEELKMRVPLQLQDAFADHLESEGLTAQLLRRAVIKSFHHIRDWFRQRLRLHHRVDKRKQSSVSPNPNSYPASIWLLPFGISNRSQTPKTNHVTWPFQRRRISKFVLNDASTFFTPTQRVEIVWEILQQARNDPGDEKKRGVEPLLAQGVYQAAFPLHDGDYQSNNDGHLEEDTCGRERLRRTWASWKCIFKEQPNGLIRSYYGEKVAFYFTFLGFYTNLLLYPAIFGAGAFLYGIFYAERSEVVRTICDAEGDPGDRIMCPVCKLPNCNFSPLWHGCWNVKWEYRVDNPATVALACFTVAWATIFLKLWKRREAELAFEWDTYDVELEDFSVRPEYEECATERKPNPITREIEPYVPLSTRLCRLVVSIFVTVLMLCGVAGALVAFIFARIQLYGALNRAGVEWNVDLSRWIVHGLIFIVVTLFEIAYNTVAEKTTSWECPRTQSQWLASYLWKIFVFQLLNDFIPISYATWIKGKSAHPFDLSWTSESCETGGCMSEATELIAVLLIARLVIGNSTEIGIPFVKKVWSKFRDKKLQQKANNLRLDSNSQWHQDALLETLEQDGVAKEYMEMIIQFAFCTLFVPAFPAAPVVCLLNNILEIRVDAINFITAHRRPLPVRVTGIGIWNTFLDIIVKLAILCNAGVISFTSGIVPRLYYQYWLSSDGTMAGYTNCSLSFLVKEKWPLEDLKYFNEHNLTGCWYEDRLNDTACTYAETTIEQESEDQIWWEVMTMRVIAFAIFTISSFTFQWLFNFLIPDIPAHVTTKIQRRRYVVTKAMETEKVYDKWLQNAYSAEAAKRDKLNEEEERSKQKELERDRNGGDDESMEQIPRDSLQAAFVYKRR